jgi:hypothetical protein
MPPTYETVYVVFSSGNSENPMGGAKIDKFTISPDLANQIEKAHPIRDRTLIQTDSSTLPTVVCMIDYTLEDALLLYRRLFYSTCETKPSECDLNQLLDRLERSTVNFYPVVVDYGGAFETKHLHLIQLTFQMLLSIQSIFCTKIWTCWSVI